MVPGPPFWPALNESVIQITCAYCASVASGGMGFASPRVATVSKAYPENRPGGLMVPAG